MLTIDTFPVGQLEANCYFLSTSGGETLIVDPGDESDFLTDKLLRNKLTPVLIVATHGHFDHCMAAFAMSVTYNIPFCIHSNDIFLLKRMQETAQYFLGVKHIDPPPVVGRDLSGMKHITLGKEKIEIIHTPGHTPGSVSFFHKSSNSVIVGDTIFAGGGVGRTDHTYSDPEAMKQTIHRLLKFDSDTVIYPGHGEAITVASAKKSLGV